MYVSFCDELYVSTKRRILMETERKINNFGYKFCFAGVVVVVGEKY